MTNYEREFVAIPSNRVNVSYTYDYLEQFKEFLWKEVAIPSNRVNVSYELSGIRLCVVVETSQSPQIGSMFPT